MYLLAGASAFVAACIAVVGTTRRDCSVLQDFWMFTSSPEGPLPLPLPLHLAPFRSSALPEDSILGGREPTPEGATPSASSFKLGLRAHTFVAVAASLLHFEVLFLEVIRDKALLLELLDGVDHGQELSHVVDRANDRG